MHRFPDGVDANHWYQTRAAPHPDWVRTTRMRPRRTGKEFDVVVLERRLCVRKRYRPPRYGVRNYRDVRLPSKEWAKRNLWVMLRGPFSLSG